MKIGTLSFELDDWEMSLSSKRRRKIICHISNKFSPSILLCAGFSVDNVKDIKWLHKQNLKSYCYVENRNCSDKTEGNRYYLIGGGLAKPIKFGPQIFSTRDELEAKPKLIKKLEISKNRLHHIDQLKLYLLVCGEINILKGRDEPIFLSRTINKLINQTDIIVNPNHDRMSDRGTLSSKREHLSSSCKLKLYINASNWHINKSTSKAGDQKQTSETLHTVFKNGERQNMIRTAFSKNYEYREMQV